MSLSVPSISASLLAPSTPFSDLLDLSDNPETPETTYSFQEFRQHRTTMQTDENYLAEPVPDRAPNFNTDDEMVDSETERKDADFDIDIDSYSSPEGIEVDDVNNAMEDDYVETAQTHSISFDNDDLMIDEEEEISYSVPQPAMLSSHGSSDLPEASQDTARLPSVQNTADIPLFSFSHQESSMPNDTQFAVQELPSVPDHSLYEEVPTDNVEVPEQVASTEAQSSKPDVEESADLNKDEETPRPQSPAKAAEETQTGQESSSGDVQGHDSTELDNDFHHHGNWSENTSTTLAHEPNLLEDQREFEGEEENAVNAHVEEGAAAEINTSIENPAAIAGFAPYNPHPIVVQFGENCLSLFPPPPPVAEDGSVGSPINDLEFLIQDHDVCEKTLDHLFQELRTVLEGVVGKDVEFVMEIEGYGVTINEDNKSCSNFSLQDILTLHVQLHQQDGIEKPEPLQISLGTRPSVTSRISSLAEAANQGMGFTHALGILESTIEDPEDSYMKPGDESNEIVAVTEKGQTAHSEHEENQEVEYNNSDDDQLLEEEEESSVPEKKVSQEVYSHLVTPVVEKSAEEESTKVNEPKTDPSTEMKKVEEEIDDDDDFDLEYGNEVKEEAEEIERERNAAAEINSKADDTKSLPGSYVASELPKPANIPEDNDSKETSVLVQAKKKTEVIIEEILNEPSQEAQQPEEIQDTPSEKTTSEKDDEELIEYEEDNEIAKNATADLEYQPDEPNELLSHHTSSGHGSPAASPHDSPPDRSSSHGSPHYSSAEHKSPIQPGSPHIQENQDQKIESPARPVSSGSDHQEAQAKKLSEIKEEAIPETQGTPTTAKVPSSIPVFQGDEGAEGQYEYVEDQHPNEYEGYEYNDQDLFELEEGEYDEEVGNEDNAEYQEGFEYASNYPVDEAYLDEERNEISGNNEAHETYVGDGAYDTYEGELGYTAQGADGYPAEYPEGNYDEDLAAYEQAEFGGANNIEIAPDTDFAVPIKGGSQSPSYAVNLLEQTSTIVKEVEEEQLIDYEDEAELVQDKLEDRSSSQHTKSPGDQKRMREDDSVSAGYGSDDENQAAKRVRAL